MNAPAVKRMTVPEFLSWAQTQDERRFELVRGHIVGLAQESAELAHAKLLAAIALRDAIRRAGSECQAFVDGLAVVIDDDTSYQPDALVNCGGAVPADSLVAPHPVIVVEALSPSTRDIDKTIKLADYFRVPGLHHYVVVDLGHRHVVHYRRQDDGKVAVAIVKDGEVVFDPPGLSIAVASLFD
jgi:Uma2 family endonuclease